MTIGIVQQAMDGYVVDPVDDPTLAWPGATTEGNTLFLWATMRSVSFIGKYIYTDPLVADGWDILYHAGVDDMDVLVAAKTADGTETEVQLTFRATGTGTTPQDVDGVGISLTEINGQLLELVVRDRSLPETNPQPFGSITPTGGIEALLLAIGSVSNGRSVSVHPSGFTQYQSEFIDTGASEHNRTWYNYEASTSGSYAPSVTWVEGPADTRVFMALVSFGALPPVGISFTATPSTGDAPLVVAFDSTAEGGTPSAYAWEFGDGGTSTSADPSHTYDDPGIYDVTLVATIDGDDYEATITISVEADFEPPSPGRAILEIKASDPGAARWDLANWDEAVWSSASWQDVTPYGVEVFITWGSSRPEFGILSTPDACTWSITFYDPERVLDPANADSPYFGDLEPLLPVRLRLESGQIIKQGFVESMSHRFEDDSGYWRVMDVQAVMANAVVPSDVTLADTLFERARDAIAAAGLSITVANDPPAGDPAVVAWETGHEATVWQWITDAAQQVHWVPYIREDNTLAFRDYQNPYNRARVIGSPNLVDLQSIIMHNGLFSVVIAGAQTRELTPKPRYGARTYERDGVVDGTTPDDGAWAQTVLDDRAVAGLRWVPGRVVPFTYAEVKYFAELEAVEQVAIQYPEASPPVSTDGIIVGGEIRVRGKKDDDAIWDFLYHVAQIPTQPLVDDLDAESYLVRDDDPTEYLYPDV